MRIGCIGVPSDFDCLGRNGVVFDADTLARPVWVMDAVERSMRTALPTPSRHVRSEVAAWQRRETEQTQVQVAVEGDKCRSRNEEFHRTAYVRPSVWRFVVEERNACFCHCLAPDRMFRRQDVRRPVSARVVDQTAGRVVEGVVFIVD